MKTKTILFIHGMWGGGWYFGPYRTYFEERGYTCYNPDLRYHDVAPGAKPPAGLGTTSLLDYSTDLEKLIKSFDEKPILIGHSMGGLLAQMLMAKGMAEAAVLLCPASPAGILALSPSVIKSFRSALMRWKFWTKPHKPTFHEAVYSMLHLLPPEQQKETYDRFVHESGRAAGEIGFWIFDKVKASVVDEKDVKAPLLVIGGSEDRITPVFITKKIASKYKAVAQYREYPNHAHWIMQEPGWEEVAGYIDDWLKGQSQKLEVRSRQ